MQDFGTVWVVMPAYNVEKFIGNTFDSLLAQTYSNWKCLCVNDGSKDRTWEMRVALLFSIKKTKV